MSTLCAKTMSSLLVPSLAHPPAFEALPRRLQRPRFPRLNMAALSGHDSSKRVAISNPSGENLVGILQESSSKDVVILCHGFRSSKESSTLKSLALALVEKGHTTFRFDFSGNGESDGEFEYGNYWKEVEDLRSVILYLKSQCHQVKAILGHSKGGNVVLLYTSRYSDVATIVNVCGRFNLQCGVKERFGEKGLQDMKEKGYLEVKNRDGEVEYRVTEKSLQERLKTDMKSAVLSIPKDCRILTVHGSDDKVVSVEDAKEFHRFILSHKLQILAGANHGFTEHRENLASIIVDFLEEKVQL